MPIVVVAIIIILIGAGLYFVNNHINMTPGTKKILNIFVVVCLVIWILKLVGFWDYIMKLTV